MIQQLQVYMLVQPAIFLAGNMSTKKYAIVKKNRNCNMKIYQFIRDNGGWDNWTMIEVAKFVCDSKKRKRKNRI